MGISVLFRRELKNYDKKFSFLSSFSTGLWASIIIAYFGVSLIITIIDRISQSQNKEIIKNKLTVSKGFSYDNSFWLVFSSLVKQSIYL